jgi:hypothetical protein
MPDKQSKLESAARAAEELLAELIGTDLIDEGHPYAKKVERIRQRLVKALNGKAKR